jgi:hypothetical protein
MNTSKAALLNVSPIHMGKQHERILATLKQRNDGYTSTEIEKIIGIKAHKRLPELRDAGKVAVARVFDDRKGTFTDLTRVVNGRRSRVWVALV